LAQDLNPAMKELGVAKTDLGEKRSCQSCGVKFYDLKKKKPVCPACETEYVPPKPKARRAAQEPAKPAPEKPKPAETEEGGDDAAKEIEEAVIETDDDDESEDGLMEDTSDIGGEDEVAVVVDTVDGDTADKN
jgi:uncharacterized protein (TIGR02300 family)